MKRVVKIFDKLNKVTTANQSFAIAFLACPLQENSKKLGLASNGISWFIKSPLLEWSEYGDVNNIMLFLRAIGLHRVSTDQPYEASFFQRQKKSNVCTSSWGSNDISFLLFVHNILYRRTNAILWELYWEGLPQYQAVEKTVTTMWQLVNKQGLILHSWLDKPWRKLCLFIQFKMIQ